MRNLQSLLAVVLLGWALATQAGLEQFEFSGAAQEDRYKELIAEVRCLVCQNQSLADSNAELAQDLRQEVYSLMQEGRTDAQIADFLVERYGDFVLYEPPVKPSTYALWYGPFVLLAIGVGFLIKTVRHRRQLQETAFTPEEEARLKQLLGDDVEGDKR